MDQFDHTRDTINVQNLFHQASDLSVDPPVNNSLPQDNNAPHSEDANHDTLNGHNFAASGVTTQNQQTQTIPYDQPLHSVLSGATVAPVDPEDVDSIDPEDLDEDFDGSEEEIDRERRRKIMIICICAGVLTVLLGLIGLIILIASGDGSEEDVTQATEGSNLICDNVVAGGIDLSGKSLDQAKNLLHLKTDHTFTKENMVVKLPGASINLSPDKTGARLDVEAVAEAAYACGRDGNESEDGTYQIGLLPYLTLDESYIQETINSFCETYSSVLSQPEIKVEGTRPQFNPENPDGDIKHQKLIITLGTPDYVLDAEDLYQQVLDAYSANLMVVEYDAPELTEPESVDVNALYEEYCTPAQDAILDPRTYEITPEVYGYGFDPEALQQLIDGAYYGETVEITFDYLVPKVLAEDFSDEMFVDTLSEYQNSSNLDDSRRDNNISLSCEAINEHVVNADDTFSFNAVIGKISTKNGYATAPISELNEAIMGGGISQTASALYVCALVADLEITERNSHEYAVDFCELGLDAFVDGGENDLCFRNNTGSPIRILAESDGGRIRVQIIGVNSLEYEVEIAPKVIKKIDPLTTYQNMERDNVMAYTDGDILQSGIPGYVVELYMEKYALNSEELLSSTKVSTSEYAKLDEVVVRITPVVYDPLEPSIPSDLVPGTSPSDDENPDHVDTTPSDGITDPTVVTELDGESGTPSVDTSAAANAA